MEQKIIPLKQISPSDDKMEEECGVFAIYSHENIENIANLAYCALFALQHRGQESAGITIINNGYVETTKGMGLVSEVFDQNALTKKVGNAAIGHVRYSTTGSSTLANAQPLSASSILGEIALAHNGNLVNANRLRYEMGKEGALFQSTTDSEVILNMIAKRSQLGVEKAIIDTCHTIRGGYAIVMLVARSLVAVRDPMGIRPLCFGKIRGTDTYVFASESCALDIVGAEFIRDVEPGEIVTVDENGLHSKFYTTNQCRASCSFEYIYFARPDSFIDGLDVYHVREMAGRYLARQQKTDADVVIGVPDSGIVAAIGYSEESGIPYSMGLVRSKYMGRSFILPNQSLREQAVKLKLNPMRKVVNGKRVILVDDSLVRGTTAKKLIQLMREAGAKEVHFRLASPMVKSECYFGVDISSKEELIASKMDLAQMCQEINADSLDFLNLENQRQILGNDKFCEGCFTGIYPMDDLEPHQHEVHIQGILDFE